MKLLGLVGGTSWVSTAEYYAHLNRLTNERLGRSEAARLVLWSLNFGDIFRNNSIGDHDANYVLILEGARAVEKAGAKGLMLCANTMHMFADKLASDIDTPVIHIAQAVADEINRAGLKRILLLGTRFTMEFDFYRDVLTRNGIEAMTPVLRDRDWVHARIYEEMTHNIFSDKTRKEFMDLINSESEKGAQGVIMGCTEIPLLLAGCDLPVPAFDSTLIHSQAAVDFALSEQ